MSKKYWVVGGIAVAAVAATALVANAHRGRMHDGYGSGWSGGGHMFGEHEGRGHGWRGRWRRSVSKEDYDARTRSRFAKWDANGDGVVDAEEAQARIERRMEGRMGRRGGRRMERMLRRFDADRDGKVTKAEAEAHVSEMFAKADLDGDGAITDADLPPMMRDRNVLSGEGQFGRHGMGRGHGRYGRRHGGRHGAKRMMHFIIGANANKDGEVTIQEVQDHAAASFKRFDRNADGVIDEADREAFMKEMTDYRVRRFMHRFGAGQDGKLTLEQFRAERDKRFARMDLDGDGTLSRDERGGGRGWHRGGRQHRGGPHGRGHEGRGMGGGMGGGMDDRPHHRGPRFEHEDGERGAQ